ncbi:hypothetical protein B0T25DRAFT_533333 [Lasiosphaeria hispida]|uniref:Ubiquitin-like protease family profile domain-containing protein n=1 Tax=Lasiosphaeria hispida TaxID=260671 RepID=A0AAJ0HQV3_9PEZI|nr:hypothetical protein B0T25DRAFT_533333 [Lasiosphaeria hispida]
MASRHDSLDSLLDKDIQKHSSPEFLKELEENLGIFRLPDIADIHKSARRVSDFNRLRLLDYSNQKLDHGPKDKDGWKFVHDNYKFVLHSELDHCTHIDDFKLNDSAGGQPVDAFLSFFFCHNNLNYIRNKEYLDNGGLYRISQRLLSWIESATQWPERPQNVWIAPDAYIIAVPPGSRTGDGHEKNALDMATLDVYEKRFITGDEGEDEKIVFESQHGDRSKDVAGFENAGYTVHFVHFHVPSNHFALIIRQKESNKAWYLDSVKGDRESRKKRATETFNKWLSDSGTCHQLKEADHTIVNVPEQDDGWSCGLHAIANAVAFCRFKVLGWHKIPRWPRDDPQLMLDELIKSIHAILRTQTPKGGNPSQPTQSARPVTRRENGRRVRLASPDDLEAQQSEPTRANPTRIRPQSKPTPGPRKQKTLPAPQIPPPDLDWDRLNKRSRQGSRRHRSSTPAADDDDASSGVLSEVPSHIFSGSGKGPSPVATKQTMGAKQRQKQTAPKAEPPPQKAEAKAGTEASKETPAETTGTATRRSSRLAAIQAGGNTTSSGGAPVTTATLSKKRGRDSAEDDSQPPRETAKATKKKK